MPKPVIPTSVFAAGNSCFTNSRVQKLKNSAKPNSGTVCWIFYGGILFWLWESKGNFAFKKARKVKGEGKPTFSTRSFPLSVFYTRNSWSFGLLLKMRCIFFTEQPYTDQRFCRWKLLFYQKPCAKAQEFGLSRILGWFAGSRFGTWHAVSGFGLRV